MFKPGTRQEKPKPLLVPEGALPWWATVKPGEMTKTAIVEEKRMRSSKAAQQISGIRFSFT